MSADLLPTSVKETPSGFADIAVWLAMGTVGVALLFAAAVQIPQEWKRMGAFPIALGALAGWGLGQWGAVKKLRGSGVVLGLSWALIVAGEVLTAIQTHRQGFKPEHSVVKPEQIERDMMTEGMRKYFSSEPEGLTEEGRDRWHEEREKFERGEQRLRDEVEARRVHRSFYGYLVNRIPKKWGKWSYPWPALFWGLEVLLGSALGTWLAFWTLQARRPAATSLTTNSEPNSLGDRGA